MLVVCILTLLNSTQTFRKFWTLVDRLKKLSLDHFMVMYDLMNHTMTNNMFLDLFLLHASFVPTQFMPAKEFLMNNYMNMPKKIYSAFSVFVQ